MSIVHNGIIENYGALKERPDRQGRTPLRARRTPRCWSSSSTIAATSPASPLQALQEALAHGAGQLCAGACCSGTTRTPSIAVKKESPLIVGWGEGENFVASDIPALLKYTRRYSVLEEGDMAVRQGPGHPVLQRLRQAGGAEVPDRGLGLWKPPKRAATPTSCSRRSMSSLPPSRPPSAPAWRTVCPTSASRS